MKYQLEQSSYKLVDNIAHSQKKDQLLKQNNLISMGNLLNPNIEQTQQSASLKINLDFTKPVIDQLKQLTNWSLEEIREIYAPFRKRKGSPILSRSEFLRFIRLSRITSFFIFEKMKSTAPNNIFQIMAILTLLSYAHKNHKVQFLFNIFDLESNKLIQFRQLVLLFTSVIRGYAIITGQLMPDHANLQKYAQTMFARADLNNDQNLELGQILAFWQTHNEANKLFDMFEPSFLGKESYHVFNSFPPYTQSEIDTIFQRLNKVYHKEELVEEDYKILTQLKISFKTKVGKQNILSQSMFFGDTLDTNKLHNTNMFQDSFISKNRKTTQFLGTLSKQTIQKISQYKMPKISTTIKQNTMPAIQRPFFKNSLSSHNHYWTSNSCHVSKFQKKPFNNIIIIKGKTITKKEVFDLRDYFDKISNGKKTILIEDFLESFNQQKYNHMKSVAASLYNFLDKNQNGKVTFQQLVLKLYPDLTKQHLKLIESWSEEYNSSFNLDKKIKANRQQQQHKKRVLPKSCIPRFRQIYHLFDRENKGYVTFEDLKRVLADVSSEKELVETFEDCDKDKDGKLSFRQFSHILLPPDLQIEGLQ